MVWRRERRRDEREGTGRWADGRRSVVKRRYFIRSTYFLKKEKIRSDLDSIDL